MGKNIKEETKNRMDRYLVALSLLGLLLTAIPLVSQEAFSFLFGKSEISSSAPSIGELTFSKNDIRHKNSESIIWGKARNSQTIRAGDSIFTGDKSQSQVKLKDGNQVDLDQNSMVTFTKIDNIEIPNLTLGNFRLTVQGKMKIAIGGEVNELEGDGSEIQIIIKDKAKPQVKLLKGNARVKGKNNKIAKLELNSVAIVETAGTEKPAELERPHITASSAPAEAIHVQELYDIFENIGGNLFIRQQPKSFSSLQTPLSWALTGEAPQVFAQLSPTPDFHTVGDSFTVNAKLKKGFFSKAYHGRNFYRLSVDGQNWNEPQNFLVKSQPLPAPVPALLASPRHASISLKPMTAPMKEPGTKGFVIEISPDKSFPAQATKVLWSDEKGISLSLTHPQILFARIRGVNGKSQLTGVSPVIPLEIEKPSLPEASFKDLKAGKFQVRLHGLDKHKRKSKEFSLAQVQVIKRPAPLLPLASQSPPQKELSKEFLKELSREPSSLEKPLESSLTSSKLKFKNSIPDYLTPNDPTTKISLEGAGFTIYSQEQIARKAANPTALTMSIRTLSWFGSNGFESYFKTKVMDIASSPGSVVSPAQAEARYRHRFPLPFSPFSGLNSSEMSLILGYEYYRNATPGTTFSSGYDLLKTGAGFNFPVLSRWGTGGELLFGFSPNKNKKYEISGFLDYSMKRDLSLGVGYRFHLFEAGVAASSPLGLPYREGFGEGYSALKWSY